VGLLSYSLYLWHWPVFSFARILVLEEMPVTFTIGLIVLSVLLAWASYRFVELPIRTRKSPLMATAPRAFAWGATASVLILLFGAGLGAWAKYVWPLAPEHAELAARAAEIHKPDWGCDPDKRMPTRTSDESACLTQPGVRPELLVWGDSHAGQLKGTLALVSARSLGSGLLRYRPSCPPLLGFTGLATRRDVEACARFNADVLEQVNANPQLRTIVLAARWTGYVDDAESEAAVAQGLERTLATLQRVGKHIVVVAPGVDFPAPVPACISRRGEAACNLARPAVDARRARALHAVQEAVARHRGVVLLDPVATLCDRLTCPVSLDGSVMYSDRHHLSQRGAERLAPALIAAVAASSSLAAGLDGSAKP